MQNKKIKYIISIVLVLLLFAMVGCKFYLPKLNGGNAPQINNENQASEIKEDNNKENDTIQSDTASNSDNSAQNVTVSTDENGNVVYEYDVDENVDYNSTEPVKDGTADDNFAVEPDVEIKYHFRNDGLLNEHFEKHGQEFPYETKEDYLLGANIMLQNPDKLHKKEKEDNDDVYYLEATNEFIIVSGDGYIRTYFKPTRGIAYYNSQ